MPIAQPDEVRRLEYGRNGKTVLAESGTSSSAEVRLWDVTAGKPIGPVFWNRGSTHPVTSGDDGNLIFMAVTYSYIGSTILCLCDPATGNSKRQGSFFLRPLCLASSPSGDTFLVGGNGPSFRQGRGSRLTPPGKRLGPRLELDAVVRAVAFSSDGKIILTGSSGADSDGGDVRLWDAHSGKPIGSVMRHRGTIRAVAFSPDDKIILSGGDDRTARFWDSASGKPIGQALAHQGTVRAVAFSPDGTLAATAGSDKTARFWHVPTGVPLGKPLRHQASVETLAFSPDGTTLLTGGADRMIRFWRVPQPLHGPVNQIKASVEAACGETLSPEGLHQQPGRAGVASPPGRPGQRGWPAC